MPKMREVALEQKVIQLNAIVSQQADRIAELERMLKHDRLEIICYENDVDSRDALIRDMRNETLREVQLMHRMSGIIPPTSTKYDERMRELGIEVDE